MIYINLVCFQAKTTGIIKFHFWHYVGTVAPGTQYPRIFCAGIRPLQLGVVLCLLFVSVKKQ